MKNLILLLVLFSCFSVSKSIAQVGMMNSNAASSQAASREVSNYSTGSANYSTRSEPVSAQRTEMNYLPAAEGTNYRNISPTTVSYSAPAAGIVNTVNANGNFYSANSAASYWVGSTTTSPYTFQPAIRYNFAAKKPYPYYASGHRQYPNYKRRSNDIQHAAHHIHRPLYEIQYYSTCYAPDPSDYDVPAYSNKNTAINASFDGYIVYKTDTVYGIVTLTNNSVFVEQPDDSTGEYGYRVSYNDKALRSVFVSNGGYRLLLTRPAENDAKLLRVIHSGKLSIYDDRFSFLTTNSIEQGYIKISYNGQFKSLGSFVILDAKHPLVKAVKKAYGIDLNPQDFNWYTLINYIDKLD